MNSVETNALWLKVMEYYRSTIKDESELSQIDRHFSQFKSFELDSDILYIGIENEMQLEWFSIYANPLTSAMRVIGGEKYSSAQVKFKVISAKQLDETHPINEVATAENYEASPSRSNLSQVAEVAPRVGTTKSMKMDATYTFENFVKGPSNSFAYAEAVAVAKAPGRTSYNPLFLWGGTGLGKTHIMQAIGHRVLKNLPGTNVCYTTAENFLNEYVNATLNDKVVAFRQRFRKVDVLLLDDVQFIAGKNQIQEEFFNTFNTLMTAHKQIVMTSDVSPRELKNIGERLISRFEGGMVTEIETPSFETRLAILKLKASTSKILVPPEILTFIAENIRSHVRALQGALLRVIAFLEINKDMNLTLDIAKKLLRDQIQTEEEIKQLTVEDIQRTTAEYYGVTLEDIKSMERTANLVTPRQVAMFLSRKLTTFSLQEIGKKFKKTHATVNHGLKAIQDRVSTEPKLRNDMTEITVKLGRSPSDILAEIDGEE